MNGGFEVRFKCRIDIRSIMCNEEWTMYVRVLIKLEIYKIELVTRIVDQNSERC
jgi:hypothetical protein